MIAKFLLRMLPGNADEDSLTYALEAARVARHARPHDWVQLREELATEAGEPIRATGRTARECRQGAGDMVLTPRFQ